MERTITLEKWEALDEEVSAVVDKISELAKYAVEDGPELTKEIAGQYRGQVKGSIDRLLALQEGEEVLGELMSHNFLGGVFACDLRLQIASSVNEITRDSVVEMVAHMNKRIWFAIHAVQSMKFWVEGAELESSEVDLSEFFADALPGLSEHDGNRIDVQLDVQEGLKGKFHVGTLATLLKNMCKNAFECGWADKVEIKVRKVGEEVVIWVADNGKGIEDQVAKKIFKYGYSGDGSTGLGLAGGRDRLKATDGTVRCYKHGGLQGQHDAVGAKFILKLPLVA